MNTEKTIGRAMELLPKWTRKDDAFKAIVRSIIIAVSEQAESGSALKVKRSGDAKQFPLIHAKKAGDVGFDLPAVFPYSSDINRTMANLINDGRAEDMIEASTIVRNDLADCGLITTEHAEKLMRDSIVIRPGERGVVPTGIFLEIPQGYWASIEARSSTSKSMLVVPKGVIDEGYRGELFAVLLNVGSEPVVIYHGDRYVQLIMHKRENMNISVVEVDELSESERGDSGFGSTGRNERQIVDDAIDAFLGEDPNNIEVD